jgi:hypothetical protein
MRNFFFLPKDRSQIKSIWEKIAEDKIWMSDTKVIKILKKVIEGLCNVQSPWNTPRVLKPKNVIWAKYASRWADEYYLFALVRTEERNILVNQVFADR